MKISEIIEIIKKFYKGPSDDIGTVTRDQVLYGDINQDCTGVVTSQWASINVIKRAIDLNANLIISHEALFWNHEDHQDWLQNSNNRVYQYKKDLLNKHNITVWRNHDFIHSGIPIKDGLYQDGIFYAFAQAMGWGSYLKGNIEKVRTFQIPETTVMEIAKKMMNVLNIEGIKIIGSPNSKVKNVCIPHHILGDAKGYITDTEKKDINLFVAMEVVDFTLSEYIRDAAQAGKSRAIITAGHFNTEEIGMKYFVKHLEYLLPQEINCNFVQSGDMYHYLVK
ncbi:hypothetical protein DS830_07920 [Bombilactobacillus bombi]|uniref:GTP cyclohydrolase 1 type 2 homolog n=1 Tax=Bombilactobacillus bombi TaxID=1303590 RepID=A0A347STQ7_9LACO|nr:Nif3-like dinuclear metal center hexameric protein [Bombilactobacillus bombi]AXX65416.1 hypothetical protein DS830_07920 [Bombilactobacillus bombi]RHW48217.1 hypothetical protein DS832_02575 [Bombilactobacillus bombi]